MAQQPSILASNTSSKHDESTYEQKLGPQLFACIPSLRTLGIDSEVNLEEVVAVEGFGHALDYYSLRQLRRLCGPFQYHFIVHLVNTEDKL